ncbi:hypothetical protein EBQ90_08455 [bacterium]|nr:hypothetical protein [bacterium]
MAMRDIIALNRLPLSRNHHKLGRMNHFKTLLLLAVISPFALSAPFAKGKTLLSPGFALPVAVDSGETGAGPSLGWLTQTESNSKFYWGGDFGLHFLGKANSLTESTTAFQFLPSVVHIGSGSESLAPTLGVSAGAYWYVAKQMALKASIFFCSFALESS